MFHSRRTCVLAARMLSPGTRVTQRPASHASTTHTAPPASLAHNLADAIALLPKLTTGIDVNLRFHDIAGVEYTQETVRRRLLGGRRVLQGSCNHKYVLTRSCGGC